MPKIEDGFAAIRHLMRKTQAVLDAQEREPVDYFTPNPGFQTEFITSQKRCRYCFCGNRAGKSQLGASEIARFALGKHPYRQIEVPNVGWVVSPDGNLSKQIMQPKIWAYLERHIANWSKRDSELTLDNGSKIFFKSCDSGVTKFTGSAIRYAAIDEDCPEDIYKEILFRTFDQQGDIWGTITPIYSYSAWMWNRIYRNQYDDPEIQCFFGSIFENAEHVPMDEIDRIKKSYGVEELAARLYGKFLKFAGLIYKEFDDSIHLVNPFPIPAGWFKFRAIDHGLSDPCACTWFALSPEDELFAYREYYRTNRTIAENCRAIIDLTDKEKIIRTYIDPTTNRRNAQTKTTDFRLYQDNIPNIRLAPLMEQTTKINQVITKLNAKKFFVFRGLPNTLTEVKTWGRTKAGEPERGGDHLLDTWGFIVCSNLKYSNISEAENAGDAGMYIPVAPSPSFQFGNSVNLQEQPIWQN